MMRCPYVDGYGYAVGVIKLAILMMVHCCVIEMQEKKKNEIELCRDDMNSSSVRSSVHGTLARPLSRSRSSAIPRIPLKRY